MARSREIKPGFFLSDELAEVSRDARLLFAGLWTLADREGRIEYRPARIRAQVFPYDADITPQVLERLVVDLERARGRFVRRYEVDGIACLVIEKFKKHQHIHPNEKPSELPAPPPVQGISGNSQKLQNDSGNYALFSEPSSSLSPQSSEPSSTCPETPEGRSAPEQVELVTESALLSFPCDGSPSEWRLVESQVKAWAEAFPALDVLGEARKALVWVQASPSNRKTARGMGKFLVGWLGRAQNRNPQRGGAGPPVRDVRVGYAAAKHDGDFTPGDREI